MRTKFKAALGSVLVTAVAAGAAVMPATSGAHGNTGPLCYGNVSYSGMATIPNGQVVMLLLQGEAFRIKETVVVSGMFWSLGHSAGSYPADYWVPTSDLRC